MHTYDVVLFIHILAVISLLAGAVLTHVALWGASRAPNVGIVRAWTAVAATADTAIPVIALVILAAGAYMVQDVWGWRHGWLDVSLAVYVALLALGPAINARRLHALHKLAEQTPDGPVTPELRARIDDPILAIAGRTMTLATIGIVFLMTVKPASAGSIVAMVVAVVIGLAWSLPALQPGRVAAPAPDAESGS